MKGHRYKDVELSIGGERVSARDVAFRSLSCPIKQQRSALRTPTCSFEMNVQLEAVGFFDQFEKLLGEPSRVVASVDIELDGAPQFLAMVPPRGRARFDARWPSAGEAEIVGEIVAWCPTVEARDAAARLLSL